MTRVANCVILKCGKVGSMGNVSWCRKQTIMKKMAMIMEMNIQRTSAYENSTLIVSCHFSLVNEQRLGGRMQR